MSDADNGYERRLTAVGVWVAPPPTAAETQAAQERFRSAWRDGDPDPDAMPRVRLPAVPVFRDDSGKTFLLLPNERGDVVAYPFAAAASGSESALAGGGYIPFGAMPSSPPADAARTDALRRAATAQAASNAGLPADAAAAAGFDFGAAAEGALRSAGLGVVQQLATASLTSAFASGGCLGGLGGALDVSAMGSALGGQLLGMGTQALFSGLWSVDDASSTGEQLAHKYGQELLGALQGEATARLQSALGLGGGGGQGTASPAQKFKDFFGGASSSATKPAARLGDKTDHGGVVDSGAGTVQLGGVPAVRLSDHETCPKSEGPVPHVGGPVFEGNPTILIEGLPAAREGHQAMCMGVGIPTALKPAKSDVLLGETTVSLPPATESSSEADGSGGSDGGAASKGAKSGADDGKKGRGPATKDGGTEKSTVESGEKGGPAAGDDGHLEEVDDMGNAAVAGAAKAEDVRTEQAKNAHTVEGERLKNQSNEANAKAADARANLEKAQLDTAAKAHDAKAAANSAHSPGDHGEAITKARVAADANARESQLEAHSKNLDIQAAKGKEALSSHGEFDPKTVSGGKWAILGKALDGYELLKGGADAVGALQRGDNRGATVAVTKTAGGFAGGSFGANLGGLGVYCGPYAWVCVPVLGFVGAYVGSSGGEILGEDLGNDLSDSMGHAPSPPK